MLVCRSGHRTTSLWGKTPADSYLHFKGNEDVAGLTLRRCVYLSVCVWLPVYNPSAWTAKAGGLQWVQGQPELYIGIYSKASSHEHCFQDYLSVCVWMGQCTWMEGTGQRQMPSSRLCTLRFVCVWVFVCAPCMRSAPTRQKRVSLEL